MPQGPRNRKDENEIELKEHLTAPTTSSKTKAKEIVNYVSLLDRKNKLILFSLFLIFSALIVVFIFTVIEENQLKTLLQSYTGNSKSEKPSILKCGEVSKEDLSKKILFEDNFEEFDMGFSSESKWIPIAQDGSVFTKKQDKKIKSGITVKSVPFKKTMDPNKVTEYYIGDHYKWMYYTNQEFELDENIAIGGKIIISANIYNVTNNPFDIKDINDPRIASVVFISYDKDSQIQNDFVITNDMIYAAIWRHPFKKDVYGDYSSYRYLYPLQKRTNINEKNLLEIVYDKLNCNSEFCLNSGSSPIVKWFIDGVEKLKIPILGNRLNQNYMTTNFGGTFEQEINPKKLIFGFGTASFLNSYSTCKNTIKSSSDSNIEFYNCVYSDFFAPVSLPIPNNVSYKNPRNVTSTEVTFKKKSPNIVENDLLFGQGAELVVENITITKYHNKGFFSLF